MPPSSDRRRRRLPISAGAAMPAWSAGAHADTFRFSAKARMTLGRNRVAGKLRMAGWRMHGYRALGFRFDRGHGSGDGDGDGDGGHSGHSGSRALNWNRPSCTMAEFVAAISHPDRDYSTLPIEAGISHPDGDHGIKSTTREAWPWAPPRAELTMTPRQ